MTGLPSIPQYSATEQLSKHHKIPWLTPLTPDTRSARLLTRQGTFIVIHSSLRLKFADLNYSQGLNNVFTNKEEIKIFWSKYFPSNFLWSEIFRLTYFDLLRNFYSASTVIFDFISCGISFYSSMKCIKFARHCILLRYKLNLTHPSLLLISIFILKTKILYHFYLNLLNLMIGLNSIFKFIHSQISSFLEMYY